MPNTRVDLHIHSALSPCASEEMRPPEVLLTAEQRGLQVVGIVDHSTGRNGWAFFEAAAAFEVQVLAGLEIESSEGVHLLALFDQRDALEDFDALIAPHLPHACSRPDVLGPQFLLDEWGEVIGEEERLLIAAVDLGLDRLVAMIADHEGLSIAAHVDRAANGLMHTLGFVPPKLQVDLLEVSWRMTRAEAKARWPELANWPLICGSDAHALEEIGQGSTVVGVDRGLKPPASRIVPPGRNGEVAVGDRSHGSHGSHSSHISLREWVAAVAEGLREGRHA